MRQNLLGQPFLLEHQIKLKSFIRRRIEDEEEVEEIYQEVWMAALESLPLFSGQSSFFTWLCGIAKHEIADYYRKKKIKTFLFSRLPWLENLASEALGPEQVLLKRELEQRVSQTLKGLKKEHKEVLQLKYYQGLTVIQIAQHLHETNKTIESRLSRARAAFAKAFIADRG